MFAYIVTTIVLFRIGMFEKVQDQQFSFIGNIILILLIVFYLVFWKRHHIINQLHRERTLEQEQENSKKEKEE
jgi:Na+/melibiose symporter-like transporter